MPDQRDRRSFLHTAAAGLVVGTQPWDRAAAKAAAPLEPWLAGLNGQHHQFLDVGAPDDGKPLRHVDNFLTAYTAAYKLQESDISVLFGAHGAGIVYVCSDALWHRFALGELFSVRDATTGAPAVRNVFFATADMPAMGLSPNASVSGLQRRAVRFLACNKTIESLAARLSGKGFGQESELRKELTAGLLPGVMPVPAMLVACNRAQEVGFRYAFLS
ncbi:MAG: hypothetical protein ACXVIJ_15700 [Thermoanaerobaculia bacterium]